MQKKVPRIAKNKLFISRIRLEETLPFPEQPAYHQYPGDSGHKGDSKASDLFCRFTADIIKENVPFTR
jgi:hypothetical protein